MIIMKHIARKNKDEISGKVSGEMMEAKKEQTLGRITDKMFRRSKDNRF